MKSTQPPMMLIPETNSNLTRTLSGGENRHFISEKEFAIWSKSHDSIRPSNAVNSNGSTSTVTPNNSANVNNNVKPNVIKDNGKGLKNYR